MLVRTLILVESGFPQALLASAVGEAAPGADCYVLGESPLPRDLAGLCGKAKVAWIDEFVSPSGSFHEDLLSRAKHLADRWIAFAAGSEWASAFEYQGLSLLEAARLSLEHQSIFPVVKQVAVLKKVLGQEPWDGIVVLGAQGTLGRTLRHLASSGLCDAASVQSVDQGREPQSQGLGRRIARRLAQGWGRQVELDLKDWMGRSAARGRRKIPETPGGPLYLGIVQGSLGAYLNTAIPVLHRLGREGRLLTLTAGDLAGAQQLRREGIPVSLWSRLVPVAAWPRIARRCRRLRGIWSKMRSGPEMGRLFQDEGMNLGDLLQDAFDSLFSSKLPRMVLWLEALSYLYRSRRPEAVLLFPDFSAPGILASLLGRRYGIPSLTVQAALSSDHAFLRTTYADVAGVVNHFSARVFENRGGVRADQVVVTGLPRWDDLVNTDWPSRAERARRQLGVSPEDKLICFATQWIPLSETKRMLQAVLQGAAGVAAARLVVKVHPAEPVEKYERLLGEIHASGPPPLVVRDIDFFALLSSCELLITSFSNVAMEAAIMRKPVLITNLTGEPDPLPYVEDGVALGAYSEEEIRRCVHELLGDADVLARLEATRNQYMRDNPELFDGKATERVVELVKQISNRRRDLPPDDERERKGAEGQRCLEKFSC